MALKYGNYTLPETITIRQDDYAWVVSRAKLPRAAGSVTLPGILNEKKFRLEGGIFRPLGTNTAHYLRGQVDAIRAAFAVNDKFYLDLDRYYENCHVENFAHNYDGNSQFRMCFMAADIITGDPFAWETAINTTNLITSLDLVTVGGNAPSLPKFSFTVSTSGTVNALIINNNTGEAFTLNGSVNNGDIILIDSFAQTVTISGVDRMDLFDGLWVSLQSGVVNNFTISLTGVPTFSAQSITWQNRWF